jgi:hypothetical protein
MTTHILRRVNHTACTWVMAQLRSLFDVSTWCHVALSHCQVGYVTGTTSTVKHPADRGSWWRPTAMRWSVQKHSILIVYTPRTNSMQKKPIQSKFSDLQHYGSYACNLLLLRHILKLFPVFLLSPPRGSCVTNSPNLPRTNPFSATHSLPWNTEHTVWVHNQQRADRIYLVYLRTP